MFHVPKRAFPIDGTASPVCPKSLFRMTERSRAKRVSPNTLTYNTLYKHSNNTRIR